MVSVAAVMKYQQCNGRPGCVRMEFNRVGVMMEGNVDGGILSRSFAVIHL
jgi:hypothetical protein